MSSRCTAAATLLAYARGWGPHPQPRRTPRLLRLRDSTAGAEKTLEPRGKTSWVLQWKSTKPSGWAARGYFGGCIDSDAPTEKVFQTLRRDRIDDAGAESGRAGESELKGHVQCLVQSGHES
ncbi:hypothetical protein BC567DRAFT_206523 [Phyllosticta citribraziliensis]